MHLKWVVIVMLITAGAGYGQDVVRRAQAVRADSPRIDGVFDAEWLKAQPADSFIQKTTRGGRAGIAAHAGFCAV